MEMKFFRNKEVRMECVIGIGLTFVGSLGAFLCNPMFGAYSLVICTILNMVHLVNTYKRYKRIQELSLDIDRILHGDILISMEKYEEGELAILENEVHKMTIRLREQQQLLLDDKKYLADSIADISHQIRTPLTSINLLLSFLTDFNTSEEKRQKTKKKVERSLRFAFIRSCRVKFDNSFLLPCMLF